MHLYAFIAILVPKLVAMVTPLCPLCTGVSQMNSSTAQALSQNQILHRYVGYNWSYGHFCDFLDYFGENLVAMATSLRPLQSEMSSLDWSTTKPPVISNHIPVISHRNAFICIYSNFCPKTSCHSVRECHRWIPRWHKPYLETNLCIDVSLTTEVMAIFVIFFGYLSQNLVAMATSRRPLQSEMSYLDWSTPKNHTVEPKKLSIAVTQTELCRFEASRQV